MAIIMPIIFLISSFLVGLFFPTFPTLKTHRKKPQSMWTNRKQNKSYTSVENTYMYLSPAWNTWKHEMLLEAGF